jgi:hypothetical protein
MGFSSHVRTMEGRDGVRPFEEKLTHSELDS